MRQTKETQRPRKREQKINKRAGIKRHRVPLSQKGETASAQRIPDRQFSAPKAVTMILRQRVSKASVVSIEKCLSAEDNRCEKRRDQQSQQQRKSRWSEPVRRRFD